MAGVRGPLFGLEASGSLGNMITWAKWKGRPYVRSLVIPHNPSTIFQRGVRAIFGFCSRNFNALSDPDKAAWQTTADIRQLTALNALISDAQNQRINGLAPRKNNVDPAGGAPGASGTLSTTPGVGRYDYHFTTPAVATLWCAIIYRQAADTAPVPGEIVGVILADGSATAYSFTETNVPAGTWHIKVKACDETGTPGTASADTTVVVS